jgi:hypothetical protein
MDSQEILGKLMKLQITISQTLECMVDIVNEELRQNERPAAPLL